MHPVLLLNIVSFLEKELEYLQSKILYNYTCILGIVNRP